MLAELISLLIIIHFGAGIPAPISISNAGHDTLMRNLFLGGVLTLVC